MPSQYPAFTTKTSMEVVSRILAIDMKHTLQHITDDELISNYLLGCEFRDKLVASGDVHGEPMDSILYLINLCLVEDERRRNNR